MNSTVAISCPYYDTKQYISIWILSFNMDAPTPIGTSGRRCTGYGCIFEFCYDSNYHQK